VRAGVPDRASPRADAGKLLMSARDFGAKGDGAEKDTAAIQQAIDRCSTFGGGEVVAPVGNYLTGAIALRPDTFLRLDQDGVIIGSPDFEDYSVTQVRWEGKLIGGRAGLFYDRLESSSPARIWWVPS
jgi:polygalacturonase